MCVGIAARGIFLRGAPLVPLAPLENISPMQRLWTAARVVPGVTRHWPIPRPALCAPLGPARGSLAPVSVIRAPKAPTAFLWAPSNAWHVLLGTGVVGILPPARCVPLGLPLLVKEGGV